MSDKKPSFTGSPKLDERFGFKHSPIVTPAEPDPPKEEDIWEVPSGYLRCSRHQVFALILIKKSKEFLMVPYSSIDSGSGTFNGDTFRFTFFKGEVAYEATIEGTITHMQRVADKIAGGKAEMIRTNGDELRSVTWAAIEEEEPE